MFPKTPAKSLNNLPIVMIGGSIAIRMNLGKVEVEYLQKKGHMSGFRVTWIVTEKQETTTTGMEAGEIGAPFNTLNVGEDQETKMEVELREVGRSVETLFWGEQLTGAWKQKSHFHKASLLMDQVGGE